MPTGAVMTKGILNSAIHPAATAHADRFMGTKASSTFVSVVFGGVGAAGVCGVCVGCITPWYPR